MSVYVACLVALLVGGLAPALWLACRRGPSNRLVGLTMVSSVATSCLILMSQVGPGQSYDLVLPLVLVPLSFAGTLVFTRLLG